MLTHPRIKVLLGTDYREALGWVPFDEMIYTGPVDEFFDFRYGKLPYRSLRFQHETHGRPVFQPAPVVNYPNEHPYTRVTEFKYLTGQEHPKTAVVYEHPCAEGDPYYPIPRPENAALYKRYEALANETAGVHFVGRLATYRYYNMDQVVAQALALYDRIAAGPAKAEPGGDARAPRAVKAILTKGDAVTGSAAAPGSGAGGPQSPRANRRTHPVGTEASPLRNGRD